MKFYLLLLHTGTGASRFVRFFTRFPYSHVAVSTDGCRTLCSFGRKRVNAFWDGGYTEEAYNGPFFSRYQSTVCRIYETELSDVQAAQVREFLAASREQKYDFLGCVPRFFGIPFRVPGRSVCSIFTADLLNRLGFFPKKRSLSLARPKDFYDLPGFTPIFVGSYADYCSRFEETI